MGHIMGQGPSADCLCCPLCFLMFFLQQGAASFIETLDTSSLKVDPDELIAHMLAAGAMTDADLEGMQQVGSGCRSCFVMQVANIEGQ